MLKFFLIGFVGLLAFCSSANALEYRLGLGHSVVPDTTILANKLNRFDYAFFERNRESPLHYKIPEFPKTCFQSPGITEVNNKLVTADTLYLAIFMSALENTEVAITCGTAQVRLLPVEEMLYSEEWHINNLSQGTGLWQEFLASIGSEYVVAGTEFLVSKDMVYKGETTHGATFQSKDGKLSLLWHAGERTIRVAGLTETRARFIERAFVSRGYSAWHYEDPDTTTSAQYIAAIDLQKFTRKKNRDKTRSEAASHAWHIYPLLFNVIMPIIMEDLNTEDPLLVNVEPFANAVRKGEQNVFLLDARRQACNRVTSVRNANYSYASDGTRLKRWSSLSFGLEGTNNWIDWRYEQGEVLIHSQTTVGFFETSVARASEISKSRSDDEFHAFFTLTQSACKERWATANGSARACKTATKSGSRSYAIIVGQDLAKRLAHENGITCF